MADESIQTLADEYLAQRRGSAANNTATDRDPAKVARARRLAQYMRASPALVEAQDSMFAKEYQRRLNESALEMGSWATGYLQDPDKAALVGKELPQITSTAARLNTGVARSAFFGAQPADAPAPRVVRSLIDDSAGLNVRAAPVDDAPRRSGNVKWTGDPMVDRVLLGRQLFSSAAGGMLGVVAGATSATQDAMGLTDGGGVAELRDLSEQLRVFYRPGEGKGAWAGERMIDAAQMVTDMAVGGGIAGKALAGYFGATTAADAYGKYAGRGGSGGESLLGAGIEGVAEYVFERGPVGALVNILGGKFVKGIVTDYIKKEVVGELATTTAQYSADQLIANPDGNWNLNDLGSQLLDTAAVALMGGAMLGVGGRAYARDLAKPAVETQNMMEAIRGQAILDAFLEDAKTSQMRVNAPEEYAELMQQGAEHYGLPKVYIPLEAIEEALADETLPEAEREVLTLYQSQIDDARTVGNGEVVIPTGELATHFAGTRLWQALSEHAHSGNGMSAKQANERRDEIIAGIETAGEETIAATEAEADTPAAAPTRTPKQQVYDTVKQQMLDAKRPLAEAQTTALLAASRAETLASSRYGQFADAMAAHKAVGFTVAPTAKSGKNAKGKAARTVNQGILAEFAADGNERFFTYTDDQGETAHIQLILGEDGSAEISVDPFSDAPNRFGTAGLRDAMRQLREQYPEVRKVWGERQSGANPGRTQHMLLPTEDVFSSTTGDGTGATEGERTQYQGARGKTDWFADGSTVVTLFAQADFSTMLHEMSHVFLEQEFKLAQADTASAELKADVEKIAAWMAANGHPVVDGVIPTEAHELWARSGERYFREGKAPSPELRDAFSQFKSWLTDIYKSIKALTAYGPAPLSDDIREIMDRIIATSEAIADNAIAPMSQADLGMTDTEYSAYRETVKGSQDAAHDILLEKMMREIRRRELSKVAAWRAGIRAKLEQTFDDQPVNIAIHLLRTGEFKAQPERERLDIKLHTGWLIDNYGEIILDQLPRSRGGQNIMRGDGVVGDVVAEIVGMSSGDALVKALKAMRVQQDVLGKGQYLRAAYVKEALNAASREHYGDMGMTDPEIREEALAALNSDRQGEVLATELRQLKKRENKGGLVTPYQLLKEWARRKIAEGTVKDAVSKSALHRYTRGLGKARTAFEEALLKGDATEATRAKQAQMINHALLAEAKRQADAVEKIVKRLKRLAERTAIGTIDPDYLDRIHELLEGYSFRAVSQTALAERDSFEKWAAGQAALGYTVYVPPRIDKLRGVKNFMEVEVAELVELGQAVSSLEHLGRRKRKYILDGQERDFNRDVAAMREGVLANVAEREMPVTAIGDSVKPVLQSVRQGRIGEALGNLLRSPHRAQLAREAGSGFTKTESLYDRFDGTKDGTGLFNRIFMHPATKCQNVFSQITEEVLVTIHEAYKGAGRDTRRLDDHMEIPELALRVGIDAEDPRAQRGLGIPITRKQFYGMLANTGNLSNLGKMVGGEKWGDHESMNDMVRVRDILWSHATADDAKIVQAMWDAAEKLWPHIERVERNMSGVVPEKVVSMEFVTPSGVTMRGGYWPVMWDAARSDVGKDMAEDIDGLQGVTFGMSTSVGHTITRTGAVGPMEYNIDIVLGAHMNKVISRIAYAEYIRDALHFINTRRISGAIDLRLGREYAQQIKSWLKDQIPSSAITLQGAKLIDRFLNGSRINMSFAVLALSYSTGMMQTLGLTFAVARLGEGSTTAGVKYIVKGFAAMLRMMPNAKGDWAHKLSGAQDFVFARSEEMMRRRHEVNQESLEVFRDLKNKNDPYHRMQAAGFWHIGMIDLYMVSLPTWLGAYAKHLDTHPGDEEGAANYGDKMVRQSQGSGRQKDLTAIQRGPPGQKFLAMFYTPGAVMFDAQWNALQDSRNGDFGKAAMPMFWMIVVGGVLGALMQGDWPDEDEEGDGKLDEWATWAIRNTLFEALFGVPVVRDAANTGERFLRKEYAEYGSTPLSFALQTTSKAGKTVYDLATAEEEEAMTGAQFKKLAMAVGLIGRLPGAQMGRSGGFVIDANSGAVVPENTYDWYHGLAYGKMPEERP